MKINNWTNLLSELFNTLLTISKPFQSFSTPSFLNIEY